MLGVEIKEFEILYNVEKTKYNQYCCCDYGYICTFDITVIKSIVMDSCPVPCQTYFVVSVQDCTSNVQCTINKTFNLEPESQFGLSSVIFRIPFMQPSLDIQVRTMVVYFSLCKFLIHTCTPNILLVIYTLKQRLHVCHYQTNVIMYGKTLHIIVAPKHVKYNTSIKAPKHVKYNTSIEAVCTY